MPVAANDPRTKTRDVLLNMADTPVCGHMPATASTTLLQTNLSMPRGSLCSGSPASRTSSSGCSLLLTPCCDGEAYQCLTGYLRIAVIASARQRRVSGRIACAGEGRKPSVGPSSGESPHMDGDARPATSDWSLCHEKMPMTGRDD